MPDFTQYVPPGVYVEQEQTPFAVSVGTSPTIVGIVGPSIGHRVFTESVTLTGEVTSPLAKTGIDTDVGLEVRGADGTLFTTADYAIVQTAAGETGEQDDTTTIARTADSTIDSASTVYVSYRYTDTEYGQPQKLVDFDTVKDIYGEPLNLETGAITSPLSLAAKIAFENGATTLVLVSTPTPGAATREEISEGYDKLTALIDVNIIVPLPVGITGTDAAPGDTLNMAGDLVTFVEQSADNDRVYRRGFIGFEADATVEPETAAASMNSERVAFAWPNKVLFYNGFANQVLTIGGYYLAAGLAGRMASLDVQIPLTRKQVRGFAGIPADVLATMTVANKNAWSAGGAMVIELNRDQVPVVRHGVTTNPSTVLTREMSIPRARDSMMQYFTDTLDASELIGGIIEVETPARIKGVIQGCLERLVTLDTIHSYQGLACRQLPGDPTIIEVKFQYVPAYPLNYIVVSFSVDALTGEITEPVAA